MELSLKYVHSNDLVNDSRAIIEAARHQAYMAVNTAMVERNWLLGKRIAEEELKGKDRATYGGEIIKGLARELTVLYGKGFTKTNLYQFVQFYKYFPQIFHAVSGKSVLLTWTHYRTLLQVDNDEAREWYARETAREMWSVRTLSRNISTQYYERHFRQPLPLSEGIKEETIHKEEILKSPLIAEFLGFKPDGSYSEQDMESSIITHLKDFLMELGRGFAFVARQQHIRTEAEDYFIDLVFYNVVLKCYVLIDLKVGKITHQDVGQMDMYVRMYDELKRTEGDNPTIGIVLCSETDVDIARYSILKGNEQIFATKYKLYLPTEEQLRREIERQKELFRLQHDK